MLVNQQLGNFAAMAGDRVAVSHIAQFIVRKEPSNESSSNQTANDSTASSYQTANNSAEKKSVETKTQQEGTSSSNQNVSSEGNNSDTTQNKTEAVKPKIKQPTRNPNSHARLSFNVLLPDEPESMRSLFEPETVRSASENWLQVLRDDEEKQNQEDYPNYFSDAYLFGMPQRHRNMITSSNAMGYDGSMRGILETTLNQLRSSNISDETRRSELREAINDDDTLQDLFSQVLRQDISRRCKYDPDMKNRPSTKKYCDK